MISLLAFIAGVIFGYRMRLPRVRYVVREVPRVVYVPTPALVAERMRGNF